jgi:alpha-galactosidase
MNSKAIFDKNVLLLENSWIKVQFDLKEKFQLISFEDVRKNISYGKQETYNIVFDRLSIDLTKEGSLNIQDVNISGIDDEYQNPGKSIVVKFCCPDAKGKKITIEKYIYIYDNTSAIRMYDVFSTETPLSGVYYSDILSFNFNFNLEMQVVDFFTCTDFSNNRVIENKIQNKNKGAFLIAKKNDKGFFFYKEGPTPDAQPIKCDYDFLVENNQVSILGVGFDSIEKQTKRRANGVVLGLLEDNELMLGLKRYQLARYKKNLDRENLFIANSWPDFNTDINEMKILKELEIAKNTEVDVLFIDDGWFDIFMGDIDENLFPNGFTKIANTAKEYGIDLGLWMNPLGLDRKHSKATRWDGAEKRDVVIENAPWNWVARSNDFYPVEEKISEVDDGTCYHAVDLRNNEYFNHLKNRIIGFYKEYGIRTYKFDLYQLNIFDTLLGDANAHYERYREFLEELKDEIPDIIISMDVTRRNRPGFDFGRDFGRLFIENRDRTINDHRYYQPYTSLKNLWDISKYIHPNKLELEMMPQFDDYSVEYMAATTFFGVPLYWGSLDKISFERAKKLQNVMKIYKKHYHQICMGLISPIGDIPQLESWSGFISISPQYPEKLEGYIILYKNGSKENEKEIKISIMNDKSFKFTNIYDKREELFLTGDKLIFNIEESFGFKLYKFIEN